MIRVLNIMVSFINVSWMLAENWIPMARLLNKYIAWNSYRLLDWSLLILSQLHAIVRPLNLCVLSMPPPIRFATFLKIFFSSLLMYKIYDSWPSRNLLEGCPKRVSLLSIESINLCQKYWKKMKIFNQILLAFSLNIVATKDWAHMLLI